jgi:NADH-quinone oxidoreductase subunit M
MLWMYQRVFFGEVKHQENESLKDLTPREIAVFAPLILMVFLMGFYSKPFISKMEPSVEKFIEEVNFYKSSARNETFGNVDVALPESPAWEDAQSGVDSHPAETHNAAEGTGDDNAQQDSTPGGMK